MRGRAHLICMLRASYTSDLFGASPCLSQAATAECTRVRRRNEQLERELASERQLLDEMKGGGAAGLDAVFGNINEMETMLDPASAKEAERRLRARAQRVKASEVVNVVDHALSK